MRQAIASSVSLALACALLVPGAAEAGRLIAPYDVYEAGPLPDGSLPAAEPEAAPWRVIHRERTGGGTWLLLALPDGAPGSDLWGTGRPRYLGRVREGERLVFVAPEISARERLRAGRPLTIAPSNGTVIVTRETPDRFARRAHQAFRMLEWTTPASVPVSHGPRPGFAAVLERARRGAPSADLRTPTEVENVIAQVSPDSLESYVRTLSEGAAWKTFPDPQKRYYSHPNTEVVHKAYIEVKFRDALGDSNVTNHAFQLNDPDGTPRTYHNVVARLPSAVPGAGAFLLTAHYDAIGVRSDPLAICAAGLRDPTSACDCSAPPSVISFNRACEWDWANDPSPGADDNATGVATLIEAARLLSGLSFDFDIYFVAFQAEELGLIGSQAFADSLAQAGREVYGVLNMDMLGYNAARNETDVITNEGSEWLADFLVETGALFVPDLPVEKHVVFFGRSDHASFWSAGYDAILLFEDLNLPYPGYHTFVDLWDTTFPPAGRPNSELQFQLSAQLAIGSLARMALHYSAPDLALPAGELEVRPQFGADFEAGRPIVLDARVHNFGTSSISFQGATTDSLTARVTFYDGDPALGAPVIAELERKGFFPAGGVVDMTTVWNTATGEEGFHEIHAVVEGLDAGYAQLEPSATNNSSSRQFFLQAPGGSAPALLTHYAYPNPVRRTRSDVQLYFELTRPASRLTVEIFDLSGQLMGSFLATDQFVTDGNQAGSNRIGGSTDFRWEGPDLQAGTYLYTIRCFGQDGSLADVGEGKFALVR